MFDFVLLVIVSVALVRSASQRFVPGVVAALASAVLLAAAATSALLSRAGEGSLAMPLGIAIMGPTVLLHERTGALRFVASPTAVAASWLVLALAAAVLARRRARAVHPDTPAAHAFTTIETAFAGIGVVAGIRLVTVALFRLLVE